MNEPRTITRLLAEWANGDQTALDQLTPLVYNDLHALARLYLSRGSGNRLLQPTELIDELYLRLIDGSLPAHWDSRSHFYGVAARLMRLVLVDHARAQRATKRGKGTDPVTLEETVVLTPGRAPDVLEVDEALCRLADIDERKAKVIELRYFGGLKRDEIAVTMGLTVPTVKRDLRLGEAWLRRYLTA